MIQEWNRFRGWVVLEFFLLYPDTRIHINGLARKLKIGTFTAQKFCSAYHKEGLLGKEEVGNTHQYSLNKGDARIRALRSFIGPYIVSDFIAPFLEKNRGILSVSIYGSFAAGDYGDRSDLDVLVITAGEQRPDSGPFRQLNLNLGRDVNITPISLAKWRSMERSKEAFFLSVKKNNVLLWGNPV